MISRSPFGHAAVYALAVTAIATSAQAGPFIEFEGVRGESGDKKPPPPPKSRPQQSKDVRAPGSGPQEGLLLPAVQSARESGGSGHSPPPPPPPPPPPQGNQAKAGYDDKIGMKPRGSRPNIAVGGINGDGKTNAANGHPPAVKLTMRKSGGSAAMQPDIITSAGPGGGPHTRGQKPGVGKSRIQQQPEWIRKP